MRPQSPPVSSADARDAGRRLRQSLRERRVGEVGQRESLRGFEAKLALVSGAVVETRARHDEDGWEEEWALGLAEGIPFVAELDRVTASFVAALDGSRPLGEILGDLAAASDSPELLRESGLRVARELLELGFATVEPEAPRAA